MNSIQFVSELRFIVRGEPVPKGRARTRIVTHGKKTFAKFYTPTETKAFEQVVALVCRAEVSAVRWAATEQDRFALEVRVYRRHEGKGGDADNYLKAVSDAINGIAWPDDRYVREVHVTLEQDVKDPRVEVTVVRTRRNAA